MFCVSSPFLLRFSHELVTALTDRELLDVTPGQHEAVVHGLAAHLSRAKGGSLISSAAAGLIAQSGVEELYATNDEMKLVVENMERIVTRG